MVFKDVKALITGGSRGIGKAISLELAKRGAFVIVNYAKNKEAAEETLFEIEKSGGKGSICKFDVSDFSSVQSEIGGILDQHGELQILVNNAGITNDRVILRMKEEDWDLLISVNLKGVFNCTKAVLRAMIKQKYGRIINLTSVVGEMGNAGQANYAASKAGIIGFTKSTAREVASRGVTVNAVSPGFIRTDITNALPEEVKEHYREAIPLGRFGDPSDVAKLVAFLASEDCSYITGEVVRINGGLYT